MSLDINGPPISLLSSSGLSKVPVPERPTYQPPVVVHNPRDNHSAASTAQVQIVVFLAINVLSLLLLRSL